MIRAAQWFTNAPLDQSRLAKVSLALNELDKSNSMRGHALPPLKVWGTPENVPLICNILRDDAFRKIECLNLLKTFQDDRSIEPMIAVLNDPFDNGKVAEQCLTEWGPTADPILAKHLHDKENRIRERIQRIVEDRQTDAELLGRQSLEDLNSKIREQRESAVGWLSKAEVPESLHVEISTVALMMLGDPSDQVRRQAAGLVGKYAQKDQADQLLTLLDDKEREMWQAGLRGLIRLEDARGADKLMKRMKEGGFKHDSLRILREAGSPAEDIVLKLLTQVELKDWGFGKELCEMLGEIGTSKSLRTLYLVKQKATAAKVPHVPDAAEAASALIRQREPKK